MLNETLAKEELIQQNSSKILILYRHDGFFQGDLFVKKHPKTLSPHKLRDMFTALGYEATAMEFSQVDVCQSFEDTYVIYASSEDNGSFIKHYIEDVLRIMEIKGAILLPSLDLLRAHHNKCFMAMIRGNFKDEALKTLNSQCVGSPDEVNYNGLEYPVVVKSAEGSGSTGVMLANNETQLRNIAKRLGATYYLAPPYTLKGAWLEFRRYIGKRPGRGARGKFIIEDFIPNLSGDYKVLVFYDRYYVIYRQTRENDFRASGSGRLNFATKDNDYSDLLSFSKRAVGEINEPIVSLDIGFDGTAFHLFEFQCVSFGPSALQNSIGYYIQNNERWSFKEEKSVLDDCYVTAIDKFIKTKA